MVKELAPLAGKDGQGKVTEIENANAIIRRLPLIGPPRGIEAMRQSFAAFSR